MTITTDPFREVPVFLKQHRPFALNVELILRTGAPIDLTGSLLRLVITAPRSKGGAVQVSSTATIDEPLTGFGRFDIQGDDLGFEPGTYDLAMTLVNADGFETTIVEGPVELTWNPDPVVPVDYTTVAPPIELVVKLLSQNRITVKVNHVPGPIGATGAQGDPGDPGVNGVNGTNGTDGAPGDPGDPGITIVVHGADPNVARPVGAIIAYWIGPANPVNALTYDIRSDS